MHKIKILTLWLTILKNTHNGIIILCNIITYCYKNHDD